MADDPWSKDCLCLDGLHVGPCWLHSDGLWRDANIRILEERDDEMAFFAFAQEEIVRLAEKVRHMRQAGVESVPPLLRRPDLDARERAALKKFTEADYGG